MNEGLDMKRIKEWKKAAILKPVLKLFFQSGSVWVAWTYRYLLEGKRFWKVKIP